MNHSSINTSTINGPKHDPSVRVSVAASCAAIQTASGGRVWNGNYGDFSASAVLTGGGRVRSRSPVFGYAEAQAAIASTQWKIVTSPVAAFAMASGLMSNHSYTRTNVRSPVHGIATVVGALNANHAPSQYGYNVYGGFKWLFRNS